MIMVALCRAEETHEAGMDDRPRTRRAGGERLGPGFLQRTHRSSSTSAIASVAATTFTRGSSRGTWGGIGAGADTDLFPKVMNNILGTTMRLVTGYPGGNDITLAMQRGGRGALRLVLVERQDQSSAMGQGRDDQAAGAAVAREARRPAR